MYMIFKYEDPWPIWYWGSTNAPTYMYHQVWPNLRYQPCLGNKLNPGAYRCVRCECMDKVCRQRLAEAASDTKNWIVFTGDFDSRKCPYPWYDYKPSFLREEKLANKIWSLNWASLPWEDENS